MGSTGNQETEAQRVCVFREVQALGTDGRAPDCDALLVADLQNIKLEELEELRKLSRPPLVVRRTLELMYLILDAARRPLKLASPDWARVQKKMSTADFLSDVWDYDLKLLRDVPALTTFLVEEYFTEHSNVACRIGGKMSNTKAPEPLTFKRVLRANQAAAALFNWCVRVLESSMQHDVPQICDDDDVTDMGDDDVTNDDSDNVPGVAPPELDVQVDPPYEAPENEGEEMSSEFPPGVIRLQMKWIWRRWKAALAPEPDRHFEGFLQFGVGKYSVSMELMPLLPSFVAALRIRPKLQLQLVTGKDNLEGDDVATWRANNTKQFFTKKGTPCCIVDSNKAASITRPAGIVVQLLLKDDSDLRRFFHSRSAAAKTTGLDLSKYWFFPTLARCAACVWFACTDEELVAVSLVSKYHRCAVLTLKNLDPIPEGVMLQLASTADWLETEFNTFVYSKLS